MVVFKDVWVDTKITNGAKRHATVFRIADEADGLLNQAILRMRLGTFTIYIKLNCTFSLDMMIVTCYSNVVPAFDLNQTKVKPCRDGSS